MDRLQLVAFPRQLVPFPKRSFDVLPPSLTRRGWGRFLGDRRTPLNPPLARGEEKSNPPLVRGEESEAKLIQMALARKRFGHTPATAGFQTALQL